MTVLLLATKNNEFLSKNMKNYGSFKGNQKYVDTKLLLPVSQST